MHTAPVFYTEALRKLWVNAGLMWQPRSTQGPQPAGQNHPYRV